MVAAGLVAMMRLHEVRSGPSLGPDSVRLWMLPTTPNYIQGVDYAVYAEHELRERSFLNMGFIVSCFLFLLIAGLNKIKIKSQ